MAQTQGKWTCRNCVWPLREPEIPILPFCIYKLGGPNCLPKSSSADLACTCCPFDSPLFLAKVSSLREKD